MTREMQPPIRQPIGFWTVRAGEAIGRRTRARLADVGVAQPEWWVLHQLSLHPAGLDDDTMIATVGPNAGDDAIVAAIASVIANGWVERRGDRLWSTSAGHDRFEVAAQVQRELEAERRHGISDDDYETTIRVLQRTIANVGGDAWHW
ncbi:hypothetical protein QSJ19_15325 [Gordonia sp. ABSL11-1]|uniref:MarR family winged helix-turn-helix transcriptional regulator n=1 Tax=Gordonia sp. ABSL11-1 TaxID=3053924 RepID=UPI002572A0B0|nr:hypothetical protein [Gordonia sp. ABSL11-1]MDL9946935.1 hypothetical protein [Gordonia sp. ABSL11-1]